MPSRLEDCTSGVAGPLYKYGCQYSDDTRLGARLAHLPRPQAVLLGPGLCLQHRGQGTPAPLRVDLRMLVPSQLLPLILVEMLVCMF